jgi:hypothetical protein
METFVARTVKISSKNQQKSCVKETVTISKTESRQTSPEHRENLSSQSQPPTVNIKRSCILLNRRGEELMA